MVSDLVSVLCLGILYALFLILAFVLVIVLFSIFNLALIVPVRVLVLGLFPDRGLCFGIFFLSRLPAVSIVGSSGSSRRGRFACSSQARYAPCCDSVVEIVNCVILRWS